MTPEPHPEERPLGRVSKDGPRASWFETRFALLTMGSKHYQTAMAFSAVAAEA